MADQNDDEIVVEEGTDEGSQDDLVAESDLAEIKVRKLKTELEQVKKEKQEYLDGWHRAKADYVNALKRFEQEKKGALMLGRVLAVSAFLPVMDSLDRAEAIGAIPEAFQGIAKQLHDSAKNLGLSKFGTVGDDFDPTQHEALGQDLASTKEEDNRITEILETGWKSADAVIRPAKVRVSHYE